MGCLYAHIAYPRQLELKALVIADAFARASPEAKSAFGNGDLYAERLVGRARHIEVQIVGDGKGGIVALGERECTLQRRSQKIVELAPSPNLKPAVAKKIVDAAVAMAKAVKYRSLGTFEFLVDEAAFYFIEANPRLQVEHTVTEEVWGVDLVKAQLLLAGGTSLAKAGLEGAAPRGHAIQLRVNMETMTADGSAKPGGGTLTVFEPPSGPGVRVDTYGYAGYRTNPNFDSLLAKVIVHSPSADFADALSRAERALAAFRLEGAPSNIAFLRALLAHGDFQADKVHTRFIDEHAKTLIAAAAKLQSGLYFQSAAPAPTGTRQAGARVDAVDPLAVLTFGKTTTEAAPEAADDAPEGTVAVPAPMQGTIVSIAVKEGDAVAAGQPLLIMDAMKMQHEIRSPARGYVRRIAVEAGETIYEGHALLFVEEADVEVKGAAAEEKIDLDHIRPDLAEYFERRAMTLDDKRADVIIQPQSVEEIRKIVSFSFTENIPVTVRGSGTGNYGQAVPLERGIVLGLAPMDRILAIESDGVAVCEPGARLGAIEIAARKVGWELRCYPSTYIKASVGGFLAGGSGGIGSITYGALRDNQTVRAIELLTMEQEPRLLRFVGDEVHQILHSWGTNGIITKIWLALGTRREWAQIAVAFPTFSEAYDFGEGLSQNDKIRKRLVTIFEWPIPSYFIPVRKICPEEKAIIFCQVDDPQLATVTAEAEDCAGQVTIAQRYQEPRRGPLLTDYTWNHTTLWALKTDPAYNAALGAAELGGLLEDFRGSYIMTFAAYNAGRGSLKKWIDRYGDPRDPKVDAVDWVELIPFSETRNYVQRVMENLQVYRARFGGGTRLQIEADLRRGASVE